MMELGKLAYNKWIEVAKMHDPRYTADWEALPYLLKRAWEYSARDVCLDLRRYADKLEAQLVSFKIAAKLAREEHAEKEKRLETKLAEAKRNLCSPTQVIGMRGSHRAIWHHEIPKHVPLTEDDILSRRSQDDEPCHFLTESSRQDEFIRGIIDNIPMLHEIPTVAYLKPGFRQPPLVSITI